MGSQLQRENGSLRVEGDLDSGFSCVRAALGVHARTKCVIRIGKAVSLGGHKG